VSTDKTNKLGETAASEKEERKYWLSYFDFSFLFFFPKITGEIFRFPSLEFDARSVMLPPFRATESVRVIRSWSVIFFKLLNGIVTSKSVFVLLKSRVPEMKSVITEEKILSVSISRTVPFSVALFRISANSMLLKSRFLKTYFVIFSNHQIAKSLNH